MHVIPVLEAKDKNLVQPKHDGNGIEDPQFIVAGDEPMEV
jgi:hypothetical protein